MNRILKQKCIIKKGSSGIEARGTLHGSLKKESLYTFLVNKNGNANICIFRRLGGIGDVLMVTPTLRAIKHLFPKVKLTFAIDTTSTKSNIYYELVKNNPFIDIIANHRLINKHDYDYTVDLTSVCIRYENSGLPTKNRIDIFSDACGLPKLNNKLPFYKVMDSDKRYLNKLPATKCKKIVLHTASFDEKRCWPIEKYEMLIKQALDENKPYMFYILDFNNKGKQWEKYSNCINCSNSSVREMAAIIDNCDLFIGPDSGPMHIAGALQKKSLILFGSIPAEARINYYKTHTPLTANVSCLGCWYKPCPFNIKCMKQIDSESVFKYIQRMLA